MQEWASYSWTYAEAFYHGMKLGFCVLCKNPAGWRESHWSNSC